MCRRRSSPASRSPASTCSRPARWTPADEHDDEITLHDAKRGIYKKVVLREDRVVGCVLYGSVADGPWYVQLMRDKADVSAFRDQLVFGRAFAEAAGASAAVGRYRGDGRRRAGLRLQRRREGRDLPRDPRQGPGDARRGAGAYQGVFLVRLLHRDGRGDPGARHRRRGGPLRRPADLQMHRCWATMRCAARSSSRS